MRINNYAYGWLAAATAALLLVPAVATLFSETVNWSGADFVVAAVLILIAGTTCILLARHGKSKHKGWLMALVMLLILLIWAELAVGVFF